MTSFLIHLILSIFKKYFIENKDIECLDGWTLACTISNGIVKINVEIWNPAKDNVNSETQKLIIACDQVFALFEVNMQKTIFRGIINLWH